MKFAKMFFALLLNTLIGATIAGLAGVDPLYGALTLNAVGLASCFFPRQFGVLSETVYTEVWTGKIVEHFTHAEQGTFLDGIPDFSTHAENDTIHLNDVSGDPTVLIDNKTYPLDIETLADGDVAIKLSKFETKPTSITDDELYALSYDKITLVKERHGNKLAEAHLDKAIHALAPASNTTDTPVLLTSGEVTDGRLRLTRADILSLKNKLDKLKVPKRGRRLVLCSDHVNDLLMVDQKFKDQYHNYESGVIYKMFGFEIYEAVNCPLFGQDLAKKSYGAVPADGDYEASVFFYVPRMFKAVGSTKMHYSEAAKDPLYKRNLISFTNRFVVLPQQAKKACAAIVSKKIGIK